MHMRDRFARIVLFGSIIGGTKRGCKHGTKPVRSISICHMRAAGASRVDYGARLKIRAQHTELLYIITSGAYTIQRERDTKQQRAESGSLSHMPRARSLACPRGGDGVGCDLCDARKVARLERVLRHDPGAAHAEHAPG